MDPLAIAGEFRAALADLIAQRDDVVDPLSGESAERFGLAGADVDPAAASTFTAWGWTGLGSLPALTTVTRSPVAWINKASATISRSGPFGPR